MKTSPNGANKALVFALISVVLSSFVLGMKLYTVLQDKDDKPSLTLTLDSTNNCKRELAWLKHDLDYKQNSVKQAKDMIEIIELDKYMQDKEYMLSIHKLKLSQDERDVEEIKYKMEQLACSKQ